MNDSTDESNDSLDTSTSSDSGLGGVQLNTVEARILGCLIEKESTTPEHYPLTVKALQTACNQKTSRDPVMDLELGKVGHTLRQLEARDLVKTVFGSRADRFEHRFSSVYDITREQQAVLALLMLRGPQTLGELLTRSERLQHFDGTDAVHHALERLEQREPPLAVRIPRAHGQREDRYAHCLSGAPDIEALSAAVASSAASSGRGSSSRIDELEERLATLEAAVERMAQQLGAN